MDERERLVALQVSVERFLYDIQMIPPWESAGAAWADKVKRLHDALLESHKAGATS